MWPLAFAGLHLILTAPWNKWSHLWTGESRCESFPGLWGSWKVSNRPLEPDLFGPDRLHIKSCRVTVHSLWILFPWILLSLCKVFKLEVRRLEICVIPSGYATSHQISQRQPAKCYDGIILKTEQMFWFIRVTLIFSIISEVKVLTAKTGFIITAPGQLTS